MKKYKVFATDCNCNTVPIFSEIDDRGLNEFLNDYCRNGKNDIDPWDKNYRWLKDYELPEFGIPYRAEGWTVSFEEV